MLTNIFASNNIMKRLYAVVLVLVVLIILVLASGRRSKAKKADNILKIYRFYPNGRVLVHSTITFGPPGESEEAEEAKTPKLGILASLHGNEIAGFRACARLIVNGWFSKMAVEKKMIIIVIPAGNPYGLRNGIRWSSNKSKPDINRNFGSEEGDDIISSQIIKALSDCDLVLDFHEGWGFYKQGTGSVGSTLMATKTEAGLAAKLAPKIVETLNAGIENPTKKFTAILDNQCDIKKTFRCYMQEHKKEYILTETSGQNNIQPIELRMRQVYTVIKTSIENL